MQVNLRAKQVPSEGCRQPALHCVLQATPRSANGAHVPVKKVRYLREDVVNACEDVRRRDEMQRHFSRGGRGAPLPPPRSGGQGGRPL